MITTERSRKGLEAPRLKRSHLFRKWTDMDAAEELRSVSTDSTDKGCAASNNSIDGSNVFSRKPLEKRKSELCVPFPNERLFRRSSIREIFNAVLPSNEQKKDDIFLLFERDCKNMQKTFTPLERYDYEDSLEEEKACLDIVEDAQDLVQEMEGKMKNKGSVSPFRNILDLIPKFDELHCNLEFQYRRTLSKGLENEDIISFKESKKSLVRSDVAYMPNYMYTVKWSAVPLLCMKNFSLYPTSLCLLQSNYIGTLTSIEENSFTDSIFSELSEIDRKEDDHRSTLSTQHEQACVNPNLWQRLFQRGKT